MQHKRYSVNLEQQWLEAKRREQEAQDERRRIEDEIVRSGAKCYGLRISQKITRKVDAITLERAARLAGCYDQLSVLFRWKPEIVVKEWEKAPEHIRSALACAITDEPARPSFTDKESKK